MQLSNEDFGMSKKYVDSDGRHILEGETISYGSGPRRFMSAYAHSHKKSSRRDDLESIGFMLMSFLRGNLPWDKVGRKKPAYLDPMVEMKTNLDFDVSLFNQYFIILFNFLSV